MGTSRRLSDRHRAVVVRSPRRGPRRWVSAVRYIRPDGQASLSGLAGAAWRPASPSPTNRTPVLSAQRPRSERLRRPDDRRRCLQPSGWRRRSTAV